MWRFALMALGMGLGGLSLTLAGEAKAPEPAATAMRAAPSPKVLARPWGEAVQGVQASLRLENLEWWKNEVPQLFLTLRNAGSAAPCVARQQEMAEVELDGKWYRWAGPVDVLSGPLEPGGSIDDLPITLGEGQWQAQEDQQPLALAPGWHRVRVSMGLEKPASPEHRVVSNVVNFHRLSILEPAPLDAAGRESGTWSRPEHGLIMRATSARPSFRTGDQIAVTLTFLNYTDEPIELLDADDKQRGTFHQFTFTDETGNELAFESPREVSDSQVPQPIPPHATREHLVWLNYWKLAGLGHPYTAIGEEPRVFLATPFYHTPVGSDDKNPRVWKGQLTGQPIRIEIVSRPPARILSPALAPDNGPEAVAVARARGEATARTDLAARRAVIVYYGPPWSQGKPLRDEATGLPVEVSLEAGCMVTACFAAEAEAYNRTVRQAYGVASALPVAPAEEGAEVLKRAEAAADAGEKWPAVRRLGELHYGPAASFLAACLQEEDKLVRASAAYALGELGREGGTLPLVAVLGREKEGEVLQQAALALPKLGARHTVADLKKVAGHPEEQTRAAVLQAIGELGDAGDIAFLARALEDASGSVRLAAAAALQHRAQASFGFALTGRPEDAAAPVAKAQAWWQEHRVEYEAPARDNDAPLHVVVRLTGGALAEAQDAVASHAQARPGDRHPGDPTRFRARVRPEEEAVFNYGHDLYFITEVQPSFGLPPEPDRPTALPSAFEARTMGVTVRVSFRRSGGRVFFHGSCEIPALVSQSATPGAEEISATTTLTRQVQFAGAADLEVEKVVEMGVQPGEAGLTLRFSGGPAK